MGDERERMANDIDALKKEVKRLKCLLAEGTATETYTDEGMVTLREWAAVAKSEHEQLAALRAVLRALVDATETTPFWVVGYDEFAGARAAAVQLLESQNP